MTNYDDWLKEGVFQGVYKWSLRLVQIITWIIIFNWIFFWLPIFKDSTDPPRGRSGMEIKIDALTGCQYLSYSGLTPRLDANGNQMCGDIK